MKPICVCGQCGANLVVEYIGNYGTIYYLRQDGSVGRKLRSVKYDSSSDGYMVYCPSCGAGYDGRFLDGKFVPYREETE